MSSNSVIEIRKVVGARLAEIHPEVYYEFADDKAQFPYLVFDLPNSFDDGTYENFVMDIDGWDAPKGGDTMPLELMMAAADAVIHRQIIRVPGMAFIMYRENRLSPPDDDKKIRRRKIIYQIRTFTGG
ncbi:hypothetical protein [Cohnella lupini]|uniref:Uncharacterized protein n=1 Tax=Cohnella lupini TaxID=1294267 RepID=A0A3D9HZC9_9BACL|nr:hypothetical protein [Cohnella lupini]RED54795.1 hypothetical protein DFP95_12151 [Cohnella lupini]